MSQIMWQVPRETMSLHNFLRASGYEISEEQVELNVEEHKNIIQLFMDRATQPPLDYNHYQILKTKNKDPYNLGYYSVLKSWEDSGQIILDYDFDKPGQMDEVIRLRELLRKN